MSSLFRLLPYLKPHRWAFVPGVICMVMSATLGGTFIFLAKKVLEPMLEPGTLDRVARLNDFVALIIAAAVLKAAADFGEVYIMERTAQRVLTTLRDDLFAHLQTLSIGYFDRQRTGDILSRLTNDLYALQVVFSVAMIQAVSAPIELAISLGAMLYFNWRLSLFVLLVLPIVAGMIDFARRRMGRAGDKLQAQTGDLVTHLQEKLFAMRLIQTFGTQAQEVKLFQKINRTTYERIMQPIRVRAALSPAIELTGMVAVVAALWFGAHDVVAGRMQAAALIVFLFAMQRTASSLRAIANLSMVLKQADASAIRLFEILDTKPEVRDAADAIDLRTRTVRGALVFDKVRFAYASGPPVLHEVSFQIEPGEIIALAGPSGSGKSTLAALVPRLYDPASGSVLLDGLDLRDVQLESLRSQIGVVPQETTLFHGTIRDNIAYGRPNATFEEIVETARRANADEFIRAQPDGYETHIGEWGSRLSGGQRQRIAIARALLRDPRILILDEATSSLDAESESLVQEALGVLMEGRTTLMIAHRFATIRKAHRILVLENGVIIETGTHEQLLRAGGLYFRLHQMQNFAPDGEDGLAPDDAALPEAAERAAAKVGKATIRIVR